MTGTREVEIERGPHMMEFKSVILSELSNAEGKINGKISRGEDDASLRAASAAGGAGGQGVGGYATCSLITLETRKRACAYDPRVRAPPPPCLLSYSLALFIIDVAYYLTSCSCAQAKEGEGASGCFQGQVRGRGLMRPGSNICTIY